MLNWRSVKGWIRGEDGMKKRFKLRAIVLGVILSNMLSLTAMAAEETQAEWLQSFQELTEAVEKLSEDSTQEEIKDVQSLFEDTVLEMKDEEKDGNSLAGSMSVDLDSAESGTSIQNMFAQMQLELAQSSKNQAMGYMNEIQKMQEEQRTVAEYLNQARDLWQIAKDSKESTAMPTEMRTYMEKKRLHLPQSGINRYDKNGWEMVILALEGYQESLGIQIQQQMVFVQDYMGQYNSYFQNLNSQISNANNTLVGLSRGQTMLGGGSAGLTVTSVLAGIVMGVCGTLLALRFRKSEKRI